MRKPFPAFLCKYLEIIPPLEARDGGVGVSSFAVCQQNYILVVLHENSSLKLEQTYHYSNHFRHKLVFRTLLNFRQAQKTPDSENAKLKKRQPQNTPTSQNAKLKKRQPQKSPLNKKSPKSKNAKVFCCLPNG